MLAPEAPGLGVDFLPEEAERFPLPTVDNRVWSLAKAHPDGSVAVAF